MRRRTLIKGSTLAASLVLAMSAWSAAAAQELEPRAYAPSPVGVTFLTAGVGRSSGELIFDPALQITDAHGKFDTAFVGVGRIIGIKQRPVVLLAALPFAWGRASGKLGGDAASVWRSGAADLRFKISVNLSGSPALSARDFAKARRRPVMGASLTGVAPTGQYSGEFLINLGANRWKFKPEVGLSVPWRRWDFDAYAAVWLFAPNTHFYPGNSRLTQRPIVALQTNAAWTFRPRLWASAGVTWYRGGEVSVGGQPAHSSFSGARVGGTLALPVGSNQSLKINADTGLWTRLGTDFTAVTVAWQIAWVRR